MEPIPPFWFKQRQCRMEPAGNDHLLKVSGPNLGEAYLHVDKGEGERWKAGLRLAPDGPDVATADAEQPSAKSAWDVAFELYRTHVIA
jgi:hypothetical protein